MNFARTLINVVVLGILIIFMEKKIIRTNPIYIVLPYVTICTNATSMLK